MSLIGLGAGLVMALALLAVIVLPFMQPQKRADAPFVQRQRARAVAYYERVLTNVRDLDDDHATGKISADEYEQERDYWIGRGVQLLKMLDELDAQHPLVNPAGADDADIDAAIERALAEKRKTSNEGLEEDA